MTVSVFDGAHFVETRTCRREATPDGGPGVLYRGLVHPLLDDARIDLSGPAFVPGDGGGAGHASAEPPQRRGPVVVRGEASGYVLVAGSVADRESVASAVRDAGAAVIRAGRYLGAPLDDLSPDWFVRFDLNGACFEAVERALGAASRASDDSAETAVELRTRLLAAELAQARARIAALEADNARLRVERAEASATAAATDPDALARLEAERAALQDALIAESRAREAAEALAAETAPAAPRQAPRGLTAEIETVLRAVTPRVRLVRDSLAFAAVELRDRGSLYRALAQIEAADAGWPPGWKKLQAASGWWERHLSDGSSDSGRLYARLDPSDRSVAVLVSTKGEQARDIAWLRRG